MSLAVVDSSGQIRAGGSIRTRSSETAEEAAIALAIASTHCHYIISDSRAAVRNFAKGRVSAPVKHIVDTNQHPRPIQIIWAPAHSSLPGNDAAHTAARGLANRAPGRLTLGSERDRMVSYQEITQHYRLARAVYPPAHKSLNKRQEVAWRRLQTNTYPNPVAYHYYYPDQYPNTCKHCKQKADLFHIMWSCPAENHTNHEISNTEQWEAVLLSSDPDLQAKVIERAEEAARAQGLVAA